MSERMAGPDAAWLHMDRPENRMIVNLVLTFERPIDPDVLRGLIRTRLVEQYPRLRQRVEESSIPFGLLALPHWVDVDDLDLDDHIRLERLSESGEEALHRFAAEHVPEPLPPHRPLWRIHMLANDEGCWAVLVRAHHALGDGIALMHGISALADPIDEPEQVGPPALVAPPVDHGQGPAADAKHVLDPVRTLFKGLGQSDGWAETMRGRLNSLQTFATRGQDVASALRGPLGRDKAVTWCAPLDLKAVRQAAKDHGGTINDLLLAAFSEGLARYLERRGTPVEHLGAMLPANVRPLDEPMPRTLGNRFGLVFPRLPLAGADLQARVREIHAETALIKAGRQAYTVFAFISAIGLTPARLENALIDHFAGMASAIITNVPGPRQQLTLDGVPIRQVMFWVPTSGPVGLGISIVSYAGSIVIGLAADRGLVPDLEKLRQDFDTAMAAWRQLVDGDEKAVAHKVET